MEKFTLETIEKLKIEFYGLVGLLEIKNIPISDHDLEIFENKLSDCQSESETAGFIVGATRRYKLKTNIGERMNFPATLPATPKSSDDARTTLSEQNTGFKVEFVSTG